MSGLLDKANKVAGDSEEVKAVKQRQSKQNLYKTKNEDKVPTGFADSAEIHPDNGLNITALKFQIGAVVGFMITMFLVFFIDTVVLFGDITLDDFFVPGLIVWWLVFNGDDI